MTSNRIRSRVTKTVTLLNCTEKAKEAAKVIIPSLPAKYIKGLKVSATSDGTTDKALVLEHGKSTANNIHNMLDIEFSDIGVSMSMFIDGKYSEGFYHYDNIFRDRWSRHVDHDLSKLNQCLPVKFWDSVNQYVARL